MPTTESRRCDRDEARNQPPLGPVRREPTPPPAHALTIEPTLDLRFGGKRSCAIRAEIVGPKDAPVVVVLGGISASAHVASNALSDAPGWWEAQVGAGAAFDTRSLRVLSIDWLGADGTLDQPIDTGDQAAALVAVCDALGIERIPLVVGASYGAMVALQIASGYRDRVGAVLAWSGGHRPHPFASAWRSVQRKILRLGGEGSRAAVSLARQLAMLGYRSPQELGERFAEGPIVLDGRVRVASDEYLEARGSAFADVFDATAFERLSESIDLHFVDPATLFTPLRLVAVEGDWLAPPEEALTLARLAPVPVETTLLASRWGHDAFLKEETVASENVRGALVWAGLRVGGAA